MKIAAYAIAKNEEQFCARWADSAKQADYRIVADTGSTDNTVSHLRSDGVTVHQIAVKPWRFDIARNAALALVPADADICITLDMDEVLVPGWREAIESVWTPQTTRIRYDYVWNWQVDGRPGIQFRADRTHARAGYVWRHPVHETLYPQHGTAEVYAESTMAIHHHADDTKPRSQYLPLLELAVAEDPANDRMAFYYARELALYGRHKDAIGAFERYLAMDSATWDQEISAAHRLMAQCWMALGDAGAAFRNLARACESYPTIRENWYALAAHCMNVKKFEDGVHYARRAIDCAPSTAYISDTIANTYGPYDVGSICAFYVPDMNLAREWWAKAAELAPNDERIKANGVFINGS